MNKFSCNGSFALKKSSKVNICKTITPLCFSLQELSSQTNSKDAETLIILQTFFGKNMSMSFKIGLRDGSKIVLTRKCFHHAFVIIWWWQYEDVTSLSVEIVLFSATQDLCGGFCNDPINLLHKGGWTSKLVHLFLRSFLLHKKNGKL